MLSEVFLLCTRIDGNDIHIRGVYTTREYAVEAMEAMKIRYACSWTQRAEFVWRSGETSISVIKEKVIK